MKRLPFCVLLLMGCDAPADHLAAARAALGPEVRAVERLPGGGWLAALREAAPGAHEVVLLRAAEGGWTAAGPVLPASDAASWGVADVDGDGAPAEVWAARVAGGRDAYRIDLQVYAPADTLRFRLQVPGGPAGVEPGQREFSFNVMDRPAVQRWLTARADSLARRHLAPAAP